MQPSYAAERYLPQRITTAFVDARNSPGYCNGHTPASSSLPTMRNLDCRKRRWALLANAGSSTEPFDSFPTILPWR
jgi:hypothetical protein